MRSKDFDKFKCVLMYFVVLQHTLYFLNGWGYYDNNLPQYNYMGEYLRCIQMPAFMLVSGFFFKKTVHKNYTCTDVLVKNILIGTIVPLVSWGVFAYLIEEIGKYSLMGFLDFFWNKFWFFKVLVFLKIVFIIEHYLFKDKYVFSLFVVICIMLSPLPQDNNFRQFNAMIPFFMMGYIVSKTSYEKLIINNTLKLRYFIPCVCFWIVLFIIGKHTIGIYDCALSSQYLSVKGMISVIYSIGLKISGTYLLFELIKKIPNITSYKWGGYTIFVYPFHCIMVDLLSTKNVFEYVNYHNALYVTARSVILAGILFVISNVLAAYVSKVKPLSFLFMGKI